MLFEELIEQLECDFALQPKPQKKTRLPHFPLFVDLSDRKIGLFGGGMTAANMASDLLNFCGSVTVITSQMIPELETLPITLTRRPYMHGDCKDFDYVLAITDNREVNHAIYEECHAGQIPVYVVDSPQESSFHFPQILYKNHAVIIGISADTDDPLEKSIVQEIGSKLDGFTLEPEKESSEG